MAKKPKKNGKKEKEEVKQEELTEWQKLHQIYLEKKAQEAALEKEKLEQRKQELRDLQKSFEEGQEDKELEDKELEDEGSSDKSVSENSEGKEESSSSEKKVEILSEKSLKAKERQERKKAKKLEKRAKKEAKKESASKIAPRHIYRALPILISSSLLLVLSLYFLSPLSTQKTITVSGNSQVIQTTILDSSGIHDKDYTLTTFLNQKAYEKNIKASDPWIKDVTISYQFPWNFMIKVTEYEVAAYNHIDEQYYPVLETGVEITNSVGIDSLPEKYLLLELNDQAMIKSLMDQLATIDKSIYDNIQKVSLTPSAATSDLLTLEMYDGNQVLVPLSEIKKKLPYYTSISKQLTAISKIDMEAGIYSTNLN